MSLKIFAVFVVFVEIGFFGYLPYIFTNIGQNKRVMSIVSCFAAGLFLALALLHILPEANEDLAHSFQKKPKIHHLHASGDHNHKIQWGTVIAMLTFVGVLTIESFVNKFLSHKEETDSQKWNDVVQTGHHHHHHTHANHSHNRTGFPSSSVILTQLALSIHAVIQCMALGSQSTTKATLTLLIGIGCHKWAEGLTLGFQYKKSNFTPQLALNFCLFHACLNAGAVLLGWLFSSASQLMSGILGGISAGTFLYVSTIERIQSQFSNSERLSQKVISMIVGIVFVCLIV